MSGHSKWANIQHRKGRQDAKRGKVFTKAAKEIIIAAKNGGDPAGNPRLRAAIAAAKAVNLPKDKIEAAIRKGTGEDAGGDLTECFYEGYGPAGIAIMVEVATDNKNRTVSEVRHYLDKYGKGMGAAGCVSWQFDKKGFLAIDGEDLDEETVMMQALEAGASDFQVEDGVFEVYTEPDDFDAVKEALTKEGFSFLEAEVQMIPQTYTQLSNEDDIKNMEKMLELMEDNDDIQAVWHNWDQD